MMMDALLCGVFENGSMQRYHKEIFHVPRDPSGREYEDVIKPIVERWERYVRYILEQKM